MSEKVRLARFEQLILPHLDAAFNLARWLVRNSHDAEDAVQDAYVRAFRFFDGFRGGDGRAWLLMIVRHTCYSWMRQNRAAQWTSSFDEESCVPSAEEHRYLYTPAEGDPETLMLQEAQRSFVQQAIEELPLGYREVLVLRELEGLSYKEIAEVTEIPAGTVMSRLARARAMLQKTLADRQQQEAKS